MRWLDGKSTGVGYRRRYCLLLSETESQQNRKKDNLNKSLVKLKKKKRVQIKSEMKEKLQQIPQKGKESKVTTTNNYTPTN